MRVEQLMSRPVQSCTAADSLAKAAELMWHNDCGCLPVVSGDGAGKLAGIVTDRDICMHALFKDRPLSELTVSQAMTTEVSVCHPEDELSKAEKVMREARVRRVPVVDAADAIVGMLTLADLAQEAVRELPSNRHEVFESEIADTLAAICRPPHKELAA